MQRKKLLITGGAGYLGCIISRYFLELGYDVTVYDNLLYSQNVLFDICYYNNFNFVFGDVRNHELLEKIIQKNEIIFPLAAIVGAPACDKDPHTTTAINYNSIEFISKVKRSDQIIIFPTTNSGYGTTDGSLYCTEKTPLNPISLYGKTKVAAEKILLESGNVVTLRLATVFGFSPRMRLDLLVNDFVYKAFKDKYLVLFEKDFKRNFLNIHDVPRLFEHILNNWDLMKNETYNAGLPDENISKEDLAIRIKKYFPDLYITSSEINKDPDKRNYIVSNEKLLKTGFNFKFSLDDGIIELKKGYTIMRDTQFKNI